MRIDKEYLLNHQYHIADNLQARIQLHRYGTNKEPFWSWVANKYPFRSGDKILEVGCGLGTFWLDVINKIPQDCEITLTDFSSGMIETAKKNLAMYAQFNFEIADIDNLAYANQSFDVVLAHFMIYHANQPLVALHEIKRVLKQNGFAGILLSSKMNMQKLFDLIECENPIQALKFTAEIAKDILPDYFTTINHYVYHNELILTEVDDIIKYVKSFSKMNEINDNFYTYMNDVLINYIKQYGNLSLDIRQHLFVVSDK